MKQALQVESDAHSEQYASLLQTLERFIAACNWLGEVAFANGIANKLATTDIRCKVTELGVDSAESIQRNIAAQKTRG